jgi:phosphoribosylaminoimidazole (AIR) synthetase
MMMRLGDIAKNQWFVILNGETAELWACVWTPNIEAKTAFNRSWMMSWVYHPNKMIYWDKVESGDILIALKQDGFRSNGLSAVRKAFALQYGENWYQDAPREEIIAASAPSVSYAKAIAEANWWYSPNFVAPVNISWIAHLSWWSFKWKLLEDMLWVKWLSAEFDNLFPIPEIVKKVAVWSQQSDKPMKSLEELYSTWCAWQGMIVAVKTKYDAENLIKILAKKWIDSQIAGKVIDTPVWEAPSIKISNVK